jgi:hypothetical protein
MNSSPTCPLSSLASTDTSFSSFIQSYNLDPSQVLPIDQLQQISSQLHALHTLIQTRLEAVEADRHVHQHQSKASTANNDIHTSRIHPLATSSL